MDPHQPPYYHPYSSTSSYNHSQFPYNPHHTEPHVPGEYWHAHCPRPRPPPPPPHPYYNAPPPTHYFAHSPSRTIAASPSEDLMKKKQQLIENGAAAESIRLCHICGIACINEASFLAHKAGKGHAKEERKAKQVVEGGGYAAEIEDFVSCSSAEDYAEHEHIDVNKHLTKVVVPKELKAEKYPHYMERQNSFRSTSVLGLIYDEVNKFQTSELHSEVVTRLPSFNEEISSDCWDIWSVLYTQYRSEMSTAMALEDKEAKEAAADEVIQKYKQILYGAPEFEESPRTKEDIFNDALAIYHLAYDYAEMCKDVGKCSFAWKVAGRALCAMYGRKQGTDLIVCQTSVLREILS